MRKAPVRKGDAGRLMQLLWTEVAEHQPRRGRARSLDLRQVVAVAVRIADFEGLAAVTMRRLAADLGVGTMSLYTYFQNKIELRTLMLDAVCLEMDRSIPTSNGWRDRLWAVAEDHRQLFEHHPWVAETPMNRPSLGPGIIGKYEHDLRALEGTSLTDVERDASLSYLVAFVASCARTAADARASRAEDDVTDEEWWARNGALLALVLTPEAYPTVVRVSTVVNAAHDTPYDLEHAFRFGLERTLDGLAALIERSRPVPVG